MSTSTPLSDLTAAVDVLAAQASAGEATGNAAQLVELARQVDRLQAVLAREVERFDAVDGHRADGAASAQAWLRHHLQLGQAEAARWVRTGRCLRSLSKVSDAWLAGAMPTAHAHHVGRGAHVDGEAMAEVEDVLVDAATRLGADQFGRLVSRALDLADPDRGAERAKTAHDERRCSVNQVGTQEVLSGAFDLADGARVRRAIEWFAEDLFRADAAVPAQDRRSPAQRNADALVEACKAGLEARATHTGARTQPTVNLTIDAHSLAGERPADLASALAEWMPSADGSPARRRCQRDDGVELPHAVAQLLSCDSSMRRIICDRSRLVDLGRASRLVTDAQRRALEIRDGGCRFPGCDRPHAWCHAHHLRHFSQGGGTDLSNLVLLCSHHHHLLHEGGYTTRGDPQTGTLRFHRSDGTEVSARPRRATTTDPPSRAARGRLGDPSMAVLARWR